MSTRVNFITVDDGDDLIVSFALEQYGESSLTLLRTPKYESLLPLEECGVSVGSGTVNNLERELLFSVYWKRQSVKITTVSGPPSTASTKKQASTHP